MPTSRSDPAKINSEADKALNARDYPSQQDQASQKSSEVQTTKKARFHNKLEQNNAHYIHNDEVSNKH